MSRTSCASSARRTGWRRPPSPTASPGRGPDSRYRPRPASRARRVSSRRRPQRPVRSVVGRALDQAICGLHGEALAALGARRHHSPRTLPRFGPAPAHTSWRACATWRSACSAAPGRQPRRCPPLPRWRLCPTRHHPRDNPRMNRTLRQNAGALRPTYPLLWNDLLAGPMVETLCTASFRLLDGPAEAGADFAIALADE
jgi:hypothetical protein